MASSDFETADAKNRAMREAGFVVPDTFEELPRVLKETYEDLVRGGVIVSKREVELGLIRKPAAFISAISRTWNRSCGTLINRSRKCLGRILGLWCLVVAVAKEAYVFVRASVMIVCLSLSGV